MTSPTTAKWREVDRFVEAFERARAGGGAADPAAFAPPADHPLFVSVLCELVRVDLEHAAGRVPLPPLEEYRNRYPALFADPEARARVAFEHYRQARERGDDPVARDYARFGVEVGAWPGADNAPPTRGVLPATSEAAPLPRVGDTFAGFLLARELGRGAFGRVFLALQSDLANRFVVLKVSSDLMGEPQTLAQLQHTHIVPVHSVHRSGPLQTICMPYFGATTLADVLRGLRDLPSLPTSGRLLVSTIQDRRSQTVVDLQQPTPGAAPQTGAPLPDRPPLTTALLSKLDSSGYVESVLWVGARLAEGLAHAHQRGIVHRDLKPANVLLTDEGQPMLLDFNLSAHVHGLPEAAAAKLGGTLPYMAPEQLVAFRGDPQPVDARGDVYSLGVILFELLTGRLPGPVEPGPVHEVVIRLVEQRRQPPPRLRPGNRAVTPAAEAIVRRCLMPDPADRYPSAEALGEDLDRHLENLPLKHQREPSLAERGRKWVRRHPRLALAAAGTTVFAGLLLLVGGLAWLLSHQLDEARQDLARDDALRQFDDFRSRKREVEVLLHVRNADLDLSREGVRRHAELLGLYQASGQDWESSSAFLALTPDEQNTLRGDISDLLFALARREALAAAEVKDDQERRARLTAALALNEQARRIGPADDALYALALQRRDLEGQLEGRPPAAAEDLPPPRSPRDFYLAASDLAARGRFVEALPLAAEAVQRDPKLFSAWFVLGNCQLHLGDFVRAEGSYSHCLALWPEFPWSWFNRGLARLNQKAWARAVRDFDQTVRLLPGQPAALINRALAKEALNDPRGALADLAAALETDDAPTRAYFLRARVHTKLGAADAAKQDRERGLKETPKDEVSFVVRGLERLPESAPAALEDFEAALALNPRSRPALQNKAHVLAEVLNRTEEAVAILDRLLEFHPDSAAGRCGRAVLLARLGQRDQAHQDAAEAQRRDLRAEIAYQAAGVYALTSKTHAEDRAEALRLLRSALERGYGLDLIVKDRDLDPIRDSAEFRRVVAAAQALRPPGPKK